MLVHKCDNCKKEIKGRDKEIIAGFAWPQFSFCGRCGKPITEAYAFFLRTSLAMAESNSKVGDHAKGNA